MTTFGMRGAAALLALIHVGFQPGAVAKEFMARAPEMGSDNWTRLYKYAKLYGIHASFLRIKIGN